MNVLSSYDPLYHANDERVAIMMEVVSDIIIFGLNIFKNMVRMLQAQKFMVRPITRT